MMIVKDYIEAKLSGQAEEFVASLDAAMVNLLRAEGEFLLSQEETATLKATAISLLPVATIGQVNEISARYAIPAERPKSLAEIPQPTKHSPLEEGYRLTEDQAKTVAGHAAKFSDWTATLKADVNGWIMDDKDLVLKAVRVKVGEKSMSVALRYTKAFVKAGSFTAADLGVIG